LSEQTDQGQYVPRGGVKLRHSYTLEKLKKEEKGSLFFFYGVLGGGAIPVLETNRQRAHTNNRQKREAVSREKFGRGHKGTRPQSFVGLQREAFRRRKGFPSLKCRFTALSQA